MVYEDIMDVKEAQVFLDDFITLTDEKELYSVLQEHYPGWITAFASDYSDDYPTLRYNWQNLCKKINVQSRGIALVSYLHPPMDPNDKERRFEVGKTFVMLESIVNHLFSLGYIIRRDDEFRQCDVCKKVRPNRKLWGFMHDRGLPCPDQYSKNCCK